MRFLTGFLIAYGLLHLYVLLKTRTAFRLRLPGTMALGCFMLLMLVAPLAVYMLDGNGLTAAARLAALFGFSWMGFLFLFVSALLMVDVCRCLLIPVRFFAPGRLVSTSLRSRAVYVVALSISVVAAFYGWFEARDVRLERVRIESAKIPEGVSVRIAQISDVHLGLIIRESHLSRIAAVLREARPDVIVSTGDLLDGRMNGLEGLENPLTGLRPPYGKFAVAGNHEHHSDLRRALSFTEKAGFRILHGEAVEARPNVIIAGVDDGPAFGIHRVPTGEDLKFLGRGGPRFVVLLRHRPMVSPGSSDLFDLQLSGHVHGGQIFPFGYVSRLFNQYFTGLHALSANSNLYVSRGTGTWGPPMRLFASPEVTLIELVHGNESHAGTR